MCCREKEGGEGRSTARGRGTCFRRGECGVRWTRQSKEKKAREALGAEESRRCNEEGRKGRRKDVIAIKRKRSNVSALNQYDIDKC
ncbi:hypothetical protein L596_023957 [Steinernema carpocapsae]|uniref:Uncharacterized protein n=1 Tax=Steinernema carpocapsae TaxID=34508 RepID=A0A4V5ZZL8_STECR|nr:hypothetical protein L596_023957 [Steinernema carpocapsae]